MKQLKVVATEAELPQPTDDLSPDDQANEILELDEFEDVIDDRPPMPAGKPDRDIKYAPAVPVREPVTDEEAEQIVEKIMLGMTSLPFEQGAKFAASEYGTKWFAAEPSGKLRSLLATRLLDQFGKSFFANKEVWEKYREGA